MYKYQKVSTERINQELDFVIDAPFQGVNILFVLPFEHEAKRTNYERHYLPTKQIKSYNVMIDGQNLFWSINKK